MKDLRTVPTTLALLALALSGTIVSPPAAAQGAGTQIKVGALRPSDSDAREAGSFQPGVLIDFILPDGQGVTAGYFEGRSRGNTLRTVPLLITRQSSGAVSAVYTGSGFGVYLIEVQNSGFKTRFGGYTAMGLRLPGGLFAEAQYHLISGNVNGVSPTGLAILVGRRF